MLPALAADWDIEQWFTFQRYPKVAIRCGNVAWPFTGSAATQAFGGWC
jgi:hypothetical protein